MNTDTVRMNITIPKTLAKALNEYAGPRKRSQCIAEALALYIRVKEKEELETALEEGYRAASEEGSGIAGEFEAADLEGWDEY